MGATLDQFDTIDFSDNDIRKLEGFPLLRRLKTIMIHNNRVCRVAENLQENLPSLTSLLLINNNITELADLDPLTSVVTLEHLSLMRNPVTHKQHYRSYVIYRLPQVKVLDFRKVKQKEREKAADIFGSRRGKDLLHEIGKKRTKTFVPGEGPPAKKEAPKGGPSAEQIAAIKAAIANAKSLEEVKHLEAQLKAGQIPTMPKQQQNATSN